MKIGFLGINYKNAGLDIRDKTSFTDNGKAEFFKQAEKLGIDQCMILSTCNRSEIYFFYWEEKQFEGVREIYERLFHEIDLKPYLVTLKGEEAVSYLFRVTAGLESLILGEDQILGQVKDALDFARTMGFAKKEMNKVVRDAITCAKRIKTELKISEKPVSVSYVGIQKLKEAVGISGKRVLVIGSGKTAVLALKYIYEYGAESVTVCSRTKHHAWQLLEEFPGLLAADYEQRYEVMEACDIVISATASPHRVVKKECLKSHKPRAFLDLAAPRDIDEEIGYMPGMYLMNLDTLKQIVAENQKGRESLVEQGQQMIACDRKETMDWLLVSRVDATIESLQQRVNEIVEDSYGYLNRKLELSQREQKIVKKVLNASLQRLLKEPIQELKQLDSREKQEEYQAVVNQLFQI